MIASEENHTDAFFLDILDDTADARLKFHKLAVHNVVHSVYSCDTVTESGDKSRFRRAGLSVKIVDLAFEYGNDVLLAEAAVCGLSLIIIVSSLMHKRFAHLLDACTVAAVVFIVACAEDESSDDVGVLTVFDLNVVLSELLHNEVLKLLLLIAC